MLFTIENIMQVLTSTEKQYIKDCGGRCLMERFECRHKKNFPLAAQLFWTRRIASHAQRPPPKKKSGYVPDSEHCKSGSTNPLVSV